MSILIDKLYDLFLDDIKIGKKFISLCSEYNPIDSQRLTDERFSEKWNKTIGNKRYALEKQKEWYLELYGFKSEEKFKNFLQTKSIILDAGCGLGFKTAWFASLAPETLVIGMDSSESAYTASSMFDEYNNLFF